MIFFFFFSGIDSGSNFEETPDVQESGLVAGHGR
jgi:hypothetical protein